MWLCMLVAVWCCEELFCFVYVVNVGFVDIKCIHFDGISVPVKV